jgi:hypothetical protein
MRSTLRIVAAVVVLVVLLVPLTTFASGKPWHKSPGPCPDDPVASKNCAPDAPPYYVVVNRTFERLGPKYGTGCVPWILENPDCKDCTSNEPACQAAAIDVEQIICGYEMPNAGAQAGDVLYEMCCDCANNYKGDWVYRERILQYNQATGAWECPDPSDWMPGLPPRTGIDLPTPIVVGGLARLGVVMVGAGFAVRRRTVRLV